MLDLIVCGCIIIGVLVGAKIGFVREAYGMVSSLLALVLAFVVYTPIKAILAVTPLQQMIYTWNVEKVSALPVVQGVQSQAQAIQDATAWLPKFIGEELIKNNNSEVHSLVGATNLAEYISSYITDLCLSVLAIILVWVVVKLILSISVGALDLIAKLPVIRTANKVLGSVLGGLKAVVSIWIVGLIFPVLVMIPQLSQLQVALDESLLSQWLYQNNIILHYMSNMLIK
ncbi:MAG: CvpA family protein [Cellulosilyticaceae bacterium]